MNIMAWLKQLKLLAKNVKTKKDNPLLNCPFLTVAKMLFPYPAFSLFETPLGTFTYSAN